MVCTLPDFLSSSSRAVFRVSAGGGAMRSTSSHCFSTMRALQARKGVESMFHKCSKQLPVAGQYDCQAEPYMIAGRRGHFLCSLESVKVLHGDIPIPVSKVCILDFLKTVAAPDEVLEAGG